MSEHIDGLVSTTVPITRANLPTGQWFEIDGSVWKAEPCEPHPLTRKDWRWVPLNITAFGKGEPSSEMTDAAYRYLAAALSPEQP